LASQSSPLRCLASHSHQSASYGENFHLHISQTRIVVVDGGLRWRRQQLIVLDIHDIDIRELENISIQMNHMFVLVSNHMIWLNLLLQYKISLIIMIECWTTKLTTSCIIVIIIITLRFILYW
jgi:hypothetical protein